MKRFKSLLPEIIEKQTLSIIGLHKNVGKTTTLNYILNLTRNLVKIGLTSIGLDGEVEDLLNRHEKPRIYIEKGTIIATAHQCISHCDITLEILEVTDIHSSLGKIVIVHAQSDGYIFLAGPAHTSEIQTVIRIMQDYGCELVLVDGAFSRRTLASPSITNTTILAVGAAFSDNMDETIATTKFLAHIFTLPQVSSSKIKALCSNIENIGYISDELKAYSVQVSSTFGGISQIVNILSLKPKYLVIKGVITDKILHKLIQNLPSNFSLSIIISDATKLLISEDIYSHIIHIGCKFYVLHLLHLLCVTINPWSPTGYHYPKDLFLNSMRNAIDIPVFDILGDE